MSTLNFPAIIARLHHASDKYVARHDGISDGYRNFKLPEVIRHVGVGDRGSMSLKNNESFWKSPIYLDQVLRKHVQVGGLGPKSSLYSKYARRKAPRVLPKLDTKPVLNEHSAAPYVQGQNVEKIESFQNEEDSGSIKGFDDDEDAAWTRNALDGNTSLEIVRAYENINGLSTDEAVVGEPTSTQHLTKRVTFSNNLSLPPIKRRRDVKKENLSDEQSQKQIPKLTLLSLDKDEDPQRIISRKINMARAIPPLQFFERKSKKSSGDSQSTFSRILKPESSPKTQAGKKLLSSLLLRTENENKKAKSKKLSTSKHPGSLLFSEEYMRLSPSNETTDKKSVNIDKKYGILIEKLPAEVVGHHVQQTYEHLWKYLINTGKKNIPKSYFQTKSEMQRNHPDMIYIPTGRPEEAFTVEGLNRKALDINTTTSEPVRLKYNHRNGEDDTEIGRSKDTSPWDIDKELKTPDTKIRTKVGSRGVRNEHIVQFKSENYKLGYNDDGIRKLSITLPPLETRTPPSTPVATYADFQSNAQQHQDCLENCTYCGTENEPMLLAPTISKEITETYLQTYPTHKKTIDFETPKNKSQPHANKTRRTKTSKVKGPIPTKQQATISSEEDQTGKTKSRVYSHGQYHVKVEEKVVHRRKPKLPKDLSNMFTKPYTFSYLTGVKAPSNISSRLYSGKVANLSSGNVTSNKYQTSLVSNVYTKSSYDVSFEHLGNQTVSDTSSLKKDAYTQFDSSICDDVSLTSQDHDLTQVDEKEFPPIVSPKLSTEYAHEIRLSPTRHRDIPKQRKSPLQRKKQSATKRRNKRLRSLSEGADEEEIKIYRATVKTYDASKFFKGAKSYNDH